MTDEQTQRYMRALVAERDGYRAKGNDRMVGVVQAQIDRLAAQASVPAKRAAKRG